MEGTEEAIGPFWSPGSDFIGFAAGGVLKKQSVQGGPAIQLCQLPCMRFFGGAWSPDGELIVFGCNDVIYGVPGRGGTASPLILPDDAQASELRRSWFATAPAFFLPSEAGARVLVYVSRIGDGAHTMIARDLETGRRELLGPGVNPFYSPSGHIVYQADRFANGLWALPFSLDTLRATGEAFPIAPNGRNATVASDGTLAYLDTSATQERWVWLDRRGEKTGEIGQVQERRDIPGLDLSPDGQFVAFTATQGSNRDLWIRHIGRGVRTRLTSDPERDCLPVWSPTGEQLAFSSFRSGNFDIFLRQADGSGKAMALVATPRDEFVADWSQDGKYLFYVVADPETGEDIWYLERTEDGSGWKPHPFLQAQSRETGPTLSPDGRHLAYLSDESGRLEVYVQPFPEGGRKATVSSAGGIQLRWRRDGKELLYVDRSGALVAVPVSTSPSFSLGTAKRLFEPPGINGYFKIPPQYDISADGQRFLVAEPVGGSVDPHRPKLVRRVQEPRTGLNLGTNGGAPAARWLAKYRLHQQTKKDR
jgi:hypothetical protein